MQEPVFNTFVKCTKRYGNIVIAIVPLNTEMVSNNNNNDDNTET